ncbi:type II methionyl aminopeptidase [Candidatus Pacearchaeota archaeon]|nr:type II methionyl aminopeptidase [Candidatus Pacearchaeota archaeon]
MEKQELESYIKAGKIAKEVKDFARGIIKPRMKLIDIAEAIDVKIDELGGEPAFPVNLSLNEIAAHYTPTKDDETIAEGILKIDIGVCVDGYIADTAFSIDLTEDGKFKEMVELNEEILSSITKIVKPGVEVHEVGDIAQETLEKWNEDKNSNFVMIQSLSGHSLDQDTIHAGLTISNYRNENKNILDGAFAIEPFVTTGAGDIYEGNAGGIYVLQSNEPVRDRDAREVLKFIKEDYKTRPFCLRWLEKEGFSKLKFVLSILVRQGILHEYPMLIEKSKAQVSQVENTFVIADGKVICTTG